MGDLADAVNEMFEWDMVDVEKKFAMATAIEGAEGLNPSFEEVRKQADWLRWEEAIHVLNFKHWKLNWIWKD